MPTVHISTQRPTPSIVKPTAAPSSSPSAVDVSHSEMPVITSALSGITPSIDMRASELPMALSSHAPQMIKV